jgi:hypothetical protein
MFLINKACRRWNIRHRDLYEERDRWRSGPTRIAIESERPAPHEWGVTTYAPTAHDVDVKDCTTHGFCLMGSRMSNLTAPCLRSLQSACTTLPPRREDECIDC